MERLALAAALALLAMAAARLLQRRRTPVPAVGSTLPTRVEPAAVGLDGAGIVCFAERSCQTCAAALSLVRGPEGGGLRVAVIDYSDKADLHRRVGIDTVPTTVVIDSDGTVIDGWVGTIDRSALAAAVLRVR